MKKFIQQAGAITFFLFILVANVAVASPSDELSRTLNAMRSMKANFKQTTLDNAGRAIQTSTGTLAWIRPGKFRWVVTKPIPQTIIANGKNLWIVDPDLMQVTVRKVKKEFGETPTMLLSENIIQLEKKFFVTVGYRSGMLVYSLKPKHADSTFIEIQIQFRNNQIVAMQLADQLGHATFIQFTHVQVNPNLSSSLFQYTPAKGMDVINEG